MPSTSEPLVAPLPPGTATDCGAGAGAPVGLGVAVGVVVGATWAAGAAIGAAPAGAAIARPPRASTIVTKTRSAVSVPGAARRFSTWLFRQRQVLGHIGPARAQ